MPNIYLLKDIKNMGCYFSCLTKTRKVASFQYFLAAYMQRDAKNNIS